MGCASPSGAPAWKPLRQTPVQEPAQTKERSLTRAPHHTTRGRPEPSRNIRLERPTGSIGTASCSTPPPRGRSRTEASGIDGIWMRSTSGRWPVRWRRGPPGGGARKRWRAVSEEPWAAALAPSARTNSRGERTPLVGTRGNGGNGAVATAAEAAAVAAVAAATAGEAATASTDADSQPGNAGGADREKRHRGSAGGKGGGRGGDRALAPCSEAEAAASHRRHQQRPRS